MESKEGYKK